MKPRMRPAHILEIETPRKVMLNGLWFGPTIPKRVIVWVHGLGSTMFSKSSIFDELIDKDTAVLAFNNRGHDKVASVMKGRKRILGGSAYEVFTDCIDDIEGAIATAKQSGARHIFLTGHSTGCQKSIYWAAKKGRGVQGIILLAPISDYSAEVKSSGKERLIKNARVAKTLVKQGKSHQLMPAFVNDWYLFTDAQRFLSLYSGAGAEEIFTYWDAKRDPKTLHQVKIPLLVLIAEKDEYRDRSAKKIADWFVAHIKLGDRVAVIPNVAHSFKGGERQVAKLTNAFMKDVAK